MIRGLGSLVANCTKLPKFFKATKYNLSIEEGIIYLLSRQIKFVVRRLQIQRSAKKMRMGCTKCTAHSHLFLLAAVDVCLITTNFTSCHPYLLHPLHQDLGEDYPPSSQQERTR